MAVNNRTEAQSASTAALVPTLTLAQLIPLVNNQILNSVKFDKDVIATETPAAGTVTINYANKDTATVTTAVNLAVSFSGLENGAVKYLVVTKGAANAISFVGALDIVQNRDYINTVLTSICYRISNKNGVIRVEGLYAPDSTTWNSLTLLGSWTGYIKYRYNNFTGKLELYFNCVTTSTTDYSIANLPASHYPNTPISLLMPNNGLLTGSAETGARLNISSINGLIQVIDKRPFTLLIGTYSIEGYTEFYKNLPIT